MMPSPPPSSAGSIGRTRNNNVSIKPRQQMRRLTKANGPNNTTTGKKRPRHQTILLRMLQYILIPLVCLMPLLIHENIVALPGSNTIQAANDPFLQRLQFDSKGASQNGFGNDYHQPLAKGGSSIWNRLKEEHARLHPRENNSTAFEWNDEDTDDDERAGVSHRLAREQARRRVRPHEKIVYLLHIHKSGGTTMCQMARYNRISASATNCNVQIDQRCCGKDDSKEAQTKFAQTSRYDFVASEGRMYEGMDVEAYRYILVLRKSQERYFSHWKHARRFYDSIPGAPHRHREEISLRAAGGKPIDEDLPHDTGGRPAVIEQMLDLKRLNKEQRREKREAKDREREAWMKAHKKGKHERREARRRGLAKRSSKDHRQRHATKLQQQNNVIQQSPSKEDETLEDFTLDAAKNKHRWFPRRRLLLGDNSFSPKLRRNHTQSTLIMSPTSGIRAKRRFLLDTEGDLEEIQQNILDSSQEDHADIGSDAEIISEESIDHSHAMGADQLSKEQHAYNQLKFRQHRMRGRRHTRPRQIMPHPAETADQIAKFLKSPNHFPLVGDTFEEWWRGQPDNWNFRQLCGSHCHGIPKYQLTLKDWEYTLERFLMFDTVLFLEEFQHSVDILAHRLKWDRYNITDMQTYFEQKAEARAIRKELKSRRGRNVRIKQDAEATDTETLTAWYRAEQAIKKEKEEKEQQNDRLEHPAEQMNENWDPFMSVLDDALYDIGMRWEALKVKTGKSSHELTSDELMDIVNIRALPESLRDYFDWYMEDEEGNHRHECTTECCAEGFCTAW